MYLEKAKTIAINIAVTFVQAGSAVWFVSNFALDKATIGAIIGAGGSAVWNGIIKPLLKKWGIMDKTVAIAPGVTQNGQ